MPQSTTIPVDYSDYVEVHVLQFDPTITIANLPFPNVGTINNGSSHVNAATILTIPSGVTWTGSVVLAASLNSIITGATATPSLTYGGTPVVELALSTPAVTLVAGASSDTIGLDQISLPGPGTLVLNFNGATLASGCASGRQQ